MGDYSFLRTAVDALTKPVTVAEWIGENSDRTLFRRTDPALLEQLRDAVASSLGGSSGSGKAARERTPIDEGAFSLLEEIDGKARAWLDELGARPGKAVSTVDVLRSWLVMYQAHPLPRTELEVARFERRIRSWTTRIVDKLNPPPSFEITAPCPECQVEWLRLGGTRDEDEQMRALVAVIREPVEAAHAQCRSCGARWEGIGGMRALRIAIDDAEQALTVEEAAHG